MLERVVYAGNRITPARPRRENPECRSDNIGDSTGFYAARKLKKYRTCSIPESEHGMNRRRWTLGGINQRYSFPFPGSW